MSLKGTTGVSNTAKYCVDGSPARREGAVVDPSGRRKELVGRACPLVSMP